MGEIGRLPSHW